MKKYLSNKTIKIFIALMFVGFSFNFIKPKAKSKLEYYKELFGQEFDFKIFELDKEKADKEDYLSSDQQKGYVVVLSSSLETEESKILNLAEDDVKKGDFLDKEESSLENESTKKDSTVENSIFQKNKYILICDSDFTYDFGLKFSCSNDFASSAEGYSLGNFIKIYDPGNSDIFVIPEKVLLTSDSRSDINNYFKAIRRSEEAPEVSEDGDIKINERGVISKIKEFKDTMIFEFFSIAFYMLIIASLSWGLLSYFGKENKKFDLSIFKDLFNSLKNLHVYQKIVLGVLLIMGLVYIPLVFFIGLKDGQGTNLGYLISYTKETFSISKLNEFSRTGSMLRIGLFGYGLIFVGLFFLFFVPIFIKVFKRAGEKISETNVNRNVIKFGLPTLILFSLLASSVFGAEDSLKFLIFVIAVLVFLFLKNLQGKVFDYIYSAKEKFIFTAVAIFIIFIGFLFNFRAGGDSFEYREEDLIGVTDEVVFLPYSKQLGENTLMNEYNFSGSEPVFVDNYLVYAPNHSRVENKNAKEFKNEGVFYIQNGDLEDIVLAIDSNEGLFNELRSEEPSNFFRIKNLKKEYGSSEPEIQITFSCKGRDIGTDKIKVDFYYLEEEEVGHDDKTLLYFPGCSKIGEPETFKVILEMPYTDSEYLFMRLVDVLGSDIEEIMIIDEDQVYSPEYFSKGRGYVIIDSGGLTDSAIVPVTNYIFGDSYDLSFDFNLDEEGKFDMSVPINELIKEGKLKDRFLIWSNKKYLPVRLP